MPIEHSDIGLAEIHLVHNWEYANAAARTGASGFIALDVGKWAKQLDDGSFWELTATTPTWAQRTGAGALADGSVTNTKLADMATQTIKGRTTAGTGDPEDLTATQATAILNAVVGDSGAGGTKGLVPAPAAGDAAAGKFLKADGTFAVPSGTGAEIGANSDITSMDGLTGALENPTQIIFPEAAAPATPGAAKVTLYAKVDGLLYSKDDAGAETLVSGGAGGGGSYAGVTTGGTGSLDFAQGAKTADEPFIDGSVTYNNAVVVFSGIKINATDTASSVGSRLIDLQVGGTSVLAVHKANSGIWNTRVTDGSNSIPGLTSIGDPDTGITWNEAANVISFLCGGGVAARIRTAQIESGGSVGFVNINGAATFRWESGTRLLHGANAVLRIDGNSDDTANAGVILGGTTTSFPRLRANGPVLESRLANDSAYAGFMSSYLRSNPVTVANLPATPTEGMLVAVTDSSTATWGDTITGGGANKVLAYFNGSAWTVAAK